MYKLEEACYLMTSITAIHFFYLSLFHGALEAVHYVNLLTTNVPHHTETNQLICIANQLTGSYMMGSIGR